MFHETIAALLKGSKDWEVEVIPFAVTMAVSV